MAAGHVVRRQIYTRQVPAERMHHGDQPLRHRFIRIGAAAPQGQPSPLACQGGCSSCGLLYTTIACCLLAWLQRLYSGKDWETAEPGGTIAIKLTSLGQ